MNNDGTVDDNERLVWKTVAVCALLGFVSLVAIPAGCISIGQQQATQRVIAACSGNNDVSCAIAIIDARKAGQ